MASPINVTDDNFEAEVLQSDQPVLVDFSAEWCGHCKQLAPIVEELADQYQGKLKVAEMDVSENTETPQKYGVMSIPNLILFKDGDVAWQNVGFLPKEKLSSALDEALAG